MKRAEKKAAKAAARSVTRAARRRDRQDRGYLARHYDAAALAEDAEALEQHHARPSAERQSKTGAKP